MPQAKFNRSALPAAARRPAQRGGHVWGLPLGAAALVAVVAAADLTGPGRAVIAAAHRFLEFYSGVFSLVALSITVLIGLAATDRVVLMIRHRVLLQAVHRSFAITAIVFLAVHVATKMMEGHAHTLDVIVPFLASHRTVYVGLGTVASYLMVLATWTGMARGRFAGSAHPGLWRALHATAYASWVVALAHGLESGRSAKTWVWVSYAGCLVLAGLALLVRLQMTWNRRLHVARAQTLSATKPAGGTPQTAPAMATDVAMFPMDTADRPRYRHPSRSTAQTDQPSSTCRLPGRPRARAQRRATAPVDRVPAQRVAARRIRSGRAPPLAARADRTCPPGTRHGTPDWYRTTDRAGSGGLRGRLHRLPPGRGPAVSWTEVPPVRHIGPARLTAGLDRCWRLDLRAHRTVHGDFPALSAGDVIELADQIRLRGRGGAGFPFARKVAAVVNSATRRGAGVTVVVNATEGEPASWKDKALLTRAPHLILDGAAIAAYALRARAIVVGLADDGVGMPSMLAALAERRMPAPTRVVAMPHRFISGESGALIRGINGEAPIPPSRKTLASDSGVGGLPTLLSNAETYAQLAIAARLGPLGYAAVGTVDEPGTVMLTWAARRGAPA